VSDPASGPPAAPSRPRNSQPAGPREFGHAFGRPPAAPTWWIDDGTSTRHVAFGFGARARLGAPLARLEGQIVVERLLARIWAIELVSEEGREAEFRPSFIFRGLRTLPLRISFR
jgi:cytochrome P450